MKENFCLLRIQMERFMKGMCNTPDYTAGALMMGTQTVDIFN